MSIRAWVAREFDLHYWWYCLPVAMPDIDSRVRLAAFEFLSERSQVFGDVLPRDLLERGFEFEGRRVPPIGPQGIFKPAILPEIPLTITTVPVVEGQARPYEDRKSVV